MNSNECFTSRCMGIKTDCIDLNEKKATGTRKERGENEMNEKRWNKDVEHDWWVTRDIRSEIVVDAESGTGPWCIGPISSVTRCLFHHVLSYLLSFGVLGNWLGLPAVPLLHFPSTGRDFWSSGRVRLDCILGGHHAPPWLRRLSCHGRRHDRWLLYRLGEKERGHAQPDWWPGRCPCTQAAEGEWSTGQEWKYIRTHLRIYSIYTNKQYSKIVCSFVNNKINITKERSKKCV